MITFPELVYDEACYKSKPELAALLNAIVLSGKIINSEIRRAGLADLLGNNGEKMFRVEDKPGEFFLCCDKLQLPSTGNTYSINEGNMRNYSQGIRNYVTKCSRKA